VPNAPRVEKADARSVAARWICSSAFRFALICSSVAVAPPEDEIMVSLLVIPTEAAAAAEL